MIRERSPKLLRTDADKISEMSEGSQWKKETKPFSAFKKNVLDIDDSNQDEVKKHFLRGAWGNGTLKSHNTGVVKLIRFAEVKNVAKTDLLPISATVLKLFFVWASNKNVSVACKDELVKTTTLKAYIAGIKAWHMFHNKQYPHQANKAVKTLLKATKMVESQAHQVETK